VTTLEQIRTKIETSVQDAVTNESVIEWCNDAQSELLMQIDVPTSTTIAINTSDLSYPLIVTNIRRINRLWLTSEREQGVDRDISIPYRIYDGQIVFAYRFGKADTLNIEYYRHLTYFTAIEQNIDLEDRYATLYSSYGIAQYYDIPSTIQRVGDSQAKRQYEKHYSRHIGIRDQIAAQFTLQTQPSTIKEAW
jgi:hypothetical protein